MVRVESRTDVGDGVVLITLDRPEKLNAWTPRMSQELEDTISSGNDDPAIGAFVVTGAGRAFCAGADIGAVFGLGFPPFLGGPFRYMDARGIDSVRTRLEVLAHRHGSRFAAAPLVVEMASSSQRFYP